MKLIYLASPYSHDDPEVRLGRFDAVCKMAGALMRTHLVFSPIAHTHPIAVHCDLPLGFAYWAEFDRRMISMCDEVWILRLPGWDLSVGVLAEIEIAKLLKKPLHYVDL